MKKYLSLMASILSLLLIISLDTKAITISDDYMYENDGNGVEIQGYLNYDAAPLNIPSSLGGNRVYSIGDAAFSFSSITQVTIPSSVEIIGKNAFGGCDNLKSIVIPNSVYKLGEGAFFQCTNLQSVTLSNKIGSIEKGTFMLCNSLNSINIPSSVKSIESNAFIGCTSLKSITIPRSVDSISDCALGFYSSNDTLVRVPGFTIKGYMGSEAERYAKYFGFTFVALDSSTVKKTVDNTVKIGSVHTVTGGKYVITSSNTARFKGPVSKKVTNFQIYKRITVHGKKYTVTGISKKAFFGCKKLKVVIIPSTIKLIGKYAFYKCKKLATIVISTRKLTKNNVQKGAFKGIASLAHFRIPVGKKAAYKKILLKRGAKKTMMFKTN